MKRSALKKLSTYSSLDSASSKLVKIGEAAKLLGVSIDTLRRWEKRGWLRVTKTPGGTRLYDKDQLSKLNPNLKRGPKSLLTPLAPTQASAPISQAQPQILHTSFDSQPKIHLASDESILKVSDSIKPHQIETDILNSFSQIEKSIVSHSPALRLNSRTLEAIKNNVQLAIVTFLLILPLLLLVGYVNNNQTLIAGFTQRLQPLSNNTLFSTKNLIQKLTGIFSPTLSHALFGNYPAGSPPGKYANKNNNKLDQLASGRVSGNYKGTNSSRTTGSVLADSTPSGSFLQINLDTQINGSLSVDTATVSGALFSATINTGFGDNEVYPMNQPLLTTSPVTFATLTAGSISGGTLSLTSGSNQLTLGNTIISTQTGGSGAFTASIPALTSNGNFVIDNAVQTLTNKTISGSSNTITNIPNSALSSSSITINAGSGLSGGGAVSLGGSITISATGSTSAVNSITGTANQVIASSSTGDITLSLPQSIAATSDVEFDSLELTSGLLLNGSTSGTVTLAAPGTVTSYTLTLPTDDGTSGYVLQTDGSGNTSWVAQSGGGGGIGGSGTINTIAKFTAANTIGNSLLTDDGTTFAINTNMFTVDQASGATTIASTLTASNGFTMTTGAIDLTATSGSISATNLTALTYSLSSGTASITAPVLNLNTTPSGSTSIGNASGDFSITSTGLNVTTGGALTGVASIDTIAVSSTALTFAAGGTLSATSSGLNLQTDGSIDVNIAGGSGATGCTVTNSNGNLACSGTITSNGTVLANYWNRSGTVLSPATTNDIVTISTNAATGTALALTSSAITTSDSAGFTNTATFTGTGSGDSYYGSKNIVSSSQALSGTAAQNLYGGYTSLTKTGADTTSGLINSYGDYVVVSNTGGNTSGQRLSVGGYFDTTGDTSGTTTAYGSQGNARNADVNIGMIGTSENTSGNAVTELYGVYGQAYKNSNATVTSTYGGSFQSGILSGSGTNSVSSAILGRVNNAGTGTITLGIGLGINPSTNTGGGDITSNYGIFVFPQTAGTSDYGARIDAADTQTLWISGNADNTTAAAGIAFGASRDTNLYRSAANTLRTDDAFNVNGVFNINTSGAITAATGITSSGTINFSSLSSNSAVYTDGSSNLTTTAPTSGTIGYWSRSSTTLSPSTANDVVSVTSNVTASPLLNLSTSGAFTGTGTNSVVPLYADSATTGDVMTISGTGLTTGTALTLLGPSGATGMTDALLKASGSVGNIGTSNGLVSLTASTRGGSNSEGVNLMLQTNVNPTAGAYAYGLVNRVSDSTNLGNLNVGIQTEVISTGNAAKALYGNFASVTTTSTTADSLIGYTSTPYINSGAVITSGTRNAVGFYSSPGSTANSTGGSTEVQGFRYGTNGTLAVGAGGTISVSAFYAGNPTMNTTGTSSKYAFYIEDFSTNAADNNYGICFDCDGTYSSSVAINGITWGTDANSVNLYRSASDTLRTDDNFVIGGTTGLTFAGTGADITFTNGETIDNDTNNQINLGLGSSGTLLLTSSTAATIANSAGALSINATATGLNLQTDGSVDVNIAGGSAATGCTIANSTGNLSCTGTLSGSNFSGSSSGTNTGDQNLFSSIVVPTQTTITANSTTTALNVEAGSGVTLATNNTTKTLTISATGTGGDITAVGDVTSGAAFTNGGSGNSLYFNNNSEVGELTATTLSDTRTWTLPDASGTICVSGSTCASSGVLGYWDRTGTTLSPSTAGDSITTSGDISTSGTGSITAAGSLIANALFDANGQFTIGDGGDTGAISATTLDIDATGALQINSSGGAISIGNDAVAQAINIGTGAAARTVTVGNNTGASALNFTSGTGAQTYTSSVQTGTTTSSAFVYNASALTSGTAFYLTSTATSGRLMDLNASQTSGTIFNLAYGSNTALSGSTTGLVVDLNSGTVDATNQNVTAANFKVPTVTDTHTSGTRSLTGMLVNYGTGGGINQNGVGGTLEFIGGDFYMPALTQTAGTLNAYGTRVTTPATITTGGSSYGQYISATGVGAGNLNGLGISSITGGSGTEYALNIGTGWDAVLRVGSTTVINGNGVTTAVGGGTGQSSYAVGDILYADTTTTLAKRNIGNANEVLTVIGGVPTWSTITGASCSNCVVTDPTADQAIAPTGQGTTGLIVRQTSTASPTDDIFQITNSAGSTKYFWVDKDGNVSTTSTAGETLTLTPSTDTTALTLVGTNVLTQALQYINANNEEGTIFEMNYGTAQTLTNSLTALDIDLSTNVTATNQSVMGTHITLPGTTNTHTSGTRNLTGFSVDGGNINQNGVGGTTVYTGFGSTIPAITQTAGTMTAYGFNVTTPSSITTGGTAYGYNVTGSGVGAGALYGFNISNITAGAGTEVGMQIGSGWDTNLLFNDTTTRVGLADGGTLTILDTAGNSLCTITDSGSTGDLSCTGTISGGGSVGYWQRVGTTLSPVNAGDNVTVDGTLDANGAFTIGDGGDTGAISATTLDIDATGALQINSSGGAISIGNDNVAQAINVGTGAAARTITIGNSTGATALAFNSGTGSQTFTSQVQTGTTTTSAFVFDATALTSGTGSYFTSDSLTTGKLLQIATSGNTLTSGTLADIRTTSTALTGTAGVGSLANLDWSPGSATTATGDLFALNIGANGTTTGNLFNILDSSSSIFSVSEVAMTTSLPANFTSPGDVSIAYDLNFTNPVASYIKSYSALTIQPGDPFGSSNLTLSPYNEGSVYIPSNVATAYGVDIDANLLSTGRALDISSSSTAGGASGASYLAYLDRSGANANASHTAYGLYSSVVNTGTTSTNIAGYFTASGASNNYGLIVAAGNVGIGDTTPSALLEVGDGTDSLQVGSAGDLTFVDANGAASITGPAGGALNIIASNSQNLALSTSTAGNISLDPAGAGDINLVAANGSGSFLNIAGLAGGTEANALCQDASGNVISCTFSSGGVSGSGTSGQIAFFNGASSITSESAGFGWDTTNKYFSIASNTGTTYGAGAGTGLIDFASTSLTTGTLLNLELTEGTLNGGHYLKAWDATGSTTVFSIGEDGNTTITGNEGSTMFTLTAGDALISDGSLGITDDDNATSFSLTNNTATTADIATLSGTNLTTGSLLTLTGPSGGTAGVTDGLFKVTSDIGNTGATPGFGVISSTATVDTTSASATGTNLYLSTINSNSTNSNLAYGIYSTLSDATSLGNDVSGIGSYVSLTNNAAKSAYGFESSVTSSSTTADFLAAYVGQTTATGTLTTGTREIKGAALVAADAGLNTGGTTNVYGLQIGTSAIAGGASATVNGYGIYIADAGGYDTTGTTRNIGLYLDPMTGADTNIGICFDCDGTWSSSTVASGIQFGTDANAVNLYRNGSDQLRTDDAFSVNGTALISSAGAVSGVTGYTQSSGAFAFSGGGNFSVDSAAFDVSTAGVISGVTGYTQSSGTFNLTAADDSLINLSAINMNDATEGLILPQNNTACSAATAEGQICWDTAGEDLYIGNGSTAVQMNGGGGSSAWSALTDPTTSLSLAFDDGEVNTFASSSDTETFWTATGNSLTTGTLYSLTSSSNSLSTGTLLSTNYTGTGAFTGSLNTLAYTPGSTPGSAPTGDLFRLSLGANATNFSGNFFNLLDNGSSVMSASKTAFTTSLPTNFTAPGDTSFAYDVNFTNPTASYIKSQAPLNIIAGETFNSSNLTLGTYNQGAIVLSTNNTTTTAVDLTSSTLTTGTGMNMSFSALTTGVGLSIASSNSSQTSASALSIAQTGVTTGYTGNLVNISGTFSGAGGGNLLRLSSANTTAGAALRVDNTTVTTGDLVNIVHTTSAITTGSLFRLSTSTTGTIATDGIALFTATGNFASTSNVGLVNITSTGASQVSSTGLNVAQSGVTTGYTGNFINFSSTSTTGTGRLLNLTSANTTNGSALAVTSASITTGNSVSITAGGATALTTGNALLVTGPTGAAALSGAAGGVVNITAAGAYTSANNAGLLNLNANATATGYIQNISGTSITSGRALNLVGPSSGATMTGNFMNLATNVGSGGSALNLSPNFTGAAVTGYGLRIQAQDNQGAANLDYGIHSVLTLSTAAAKTGVSIHGETSTSSTTADLSAGVLGKSTVSAGFTNAGTRQAYGVIGDVDYTGANSGSAVLSLTYGGIFSANSTGAHSAGINIFVGAAGIGSMSGPTTGSTNAVYGLYAGNPAAAETVTVASGTVAYTGLHIQNPNMNTTGTTSKYGILIEDVTAGSTDADTNYSIYSAGGDSYFAGNVGIGTTAPTIPLYVSNGVSGNTVARILASGNSSNPGNALQLSNGYATSSGGNNYEILGAYANNFSGSPLFTVRDSGNIGIGTAAPGEQVELAKASGVPILALNHTGETSFTSAIRFKNDGTNQFGILADIGGTGTNTFTIYDYIGTTNRLHIASNGDTSITGSGGTCTMTGAATGTSCGSDINLKENITSYGSSLDKIMQLNPVNFTWRNKKLDQSVQEGFIAQQVQNVFPEMVSKMDNGYLGVRYDAFIIPTIKALQELNSKVDNALLTINPDGTTTTNLNIQKITVSTDAKIGGLVSAQNFALDASLLNKSGAMASVPVSGDNKVSLADSVNALNSQTNSNTNKLSQIQLEQASQSAQLAEAKILGEQAVNHAQTLDEKVASTSANLSSLSSRIDDLLASISGSESESTDSGELDLTPPTELIATDSATFANLDVTENLSTLNIEALDATISSTFKSLGETFLGQTTIAGDLSVDGTMSLTNGNSINAFPTLFFQNNPLAEAVDFFNGAITLDKNGLFASEAIALGNESLGEATITAGQLEVTIPTSLVTSTSKIFLTPSTAVNGNLYVGQKVEGSGFKVKLSTPNQTPVKFNWMIVQTKETSL